VRGGIALGDFRLLETIVAGPKGFKTVDSYLKRMLSFGESSKKLGVLRVRLFTLRLIALDVSQRNARKTSGALNTAVEVYDTIIVGLLGR